MSMSELKNQMRSDLKESMKAKDEPRTGALRMLLAALQEETKGSKHELTDADVLAVVAREIKKRRESAEVYTDNDRPELAEEELKDVPFFESYQPEQLDDAGVDDLVAESIAEVEAESDGPVGMKQMGQVMKIANEKAAGRADGKRLSSAVKAKLQG